MSDFGSLSDKGIDISGFPSHQSVGFNMGKDSVDQKRKFIGMNQGSASMGKVVHLYNFENIRNKTETPLLMQVVLNGAEQAGYMDGITFYKFERIIENLEDEETLTLGDQTFSNEMILDESIQCFILGTLTFFEVDFKRVDFTGSTFVNCEFKNCRFKDVILRKCEFWNPTFENCQIERSNLTRANFHKGTFRNCIFIKSNLTASNFSEFEFIKTKFNNSDLDLIGARSIKV